MERGKEESFKLYEQEYFELADEAAGLVRKMRNTSDDAQRKEIRKQLRPIDERRVELLNAMDTIRNQ